MFRPPCCPARLLAGRGARTGRGKSGQPFLIAGGASSGERDAYPRDVGVPSALRCPACDLPAGRRGHGRKNPGANRGGDAVPAAEPSTRPDALGQALEHRAGHHNPQSRPSGRVRMHPFLWNLRDSNPPPPVCQTGALPTELRPHVPAALVRARPAKGVARAAGLVVAPAGPDLMPFRCGVLKSRPGPDVSMPAVVRGGQAEAEGIEPP